jgi:hypothetical protein
MPRQPEVFVRELDPDEAQRLVRITRTARDRVRLRRAGIVLASSRAAALPRRPRCSRRSRSMRAKMHRILDLYDRSATGQIPDGGRVICVDEFGPLNLQPRPGRGWFPTRRPARLRATYHRHGGVRHMFAALDLASGHLFYRLRDRKRSQEFLAFLRQVRTRFPTGRLFIVCDNFSPHRKATVAAWCAAHDVELVFTPTYASWLNWIESEFTALRYFTLDGSDYPSHSAQEAAIAGYIRWANRHARPKRRFAPESKIRRPVTYRTLPDEALVEGPYSPSRDAALSFQREPSSM